MANNKVSAQFLYNIRKKYANDPIRQVYEAAKYGDADLLNEVLGQMSDSERTSALETKTTSNWYGKFDELKDAFTPLIVAAEKGNVDCMKVVLSYNADVNCRGDLFNPNARTTENCTPLMIASWSGHVNVVNFLVEHGADVDLQDKNGDTALHYAVHRNSLEVANKLLSLGASQLYNKRRFTPLLFASNKAHMTAMVESLINRPECTKEQRIDALELHGASLAIDHLASTRGKAFYYLRSGMEERFHDPSHPVLKQPLEPVEGYQNRKESQTLEELVQIEGDLDAIIMESLIVKERILGADNLELLSPIKKVARIYEESGRFDICIGLRIHAMEIGQHCNQSVLWTLWDIHELIELLYTMIQNNFSPRQEVVLEVIQKTALECEKLVGKIKLAEELEREYSVESIREFKGSKDRLDHFLLRLLQILAHTELCDDDENMCIPVLRQKLKFCLNTQDDQGNTLLHMATKRQKKFDFYRDYCFARRKAPFEFPCAKTVKLLLNGGINVNVINSNGDTPLHTAVTFNPTEDDDDFNYDRYDDDDDDNDYPYERDRIRHLTDTLEVLLDGGANHNFVNSDGKTATDMVVTDEARGILSERKTLELKSIAAKAVKKLGLPYLGLVPKTLEKFISMH